MFCVFVTRCVLCVSERRMAGVKDRGAVPWHGVPGFQSAGGHPAPSGPRGGPCQAPGNTDLCYSILLLGKVRE